MKEVIKNAGNIRIKLGRDFISIRGLFLVRVVIKNKKTWDRKLS